MRIYCKMLELNYMQDIAILIEIIFQDVSPNLLVINMSFMKITNWSLSVSCC